MSTQSTRRAKGRKRHESSGCSRLPSAALRFRAFSSEEPAILDQVLCWVFNPFHAMTLTEAMNRASLSMTPSQRILLCERVGESPKASRPVRKLKARGVTFSRSSDYETGFGCKIVALAEEVEEVEVAPVPLRFDHDKFLDNRGTALETVDELLLGDDGSIQAVLALA